jgi:hypothetical protein
LESSAAGKGKLGDLEAGLGILTKIFVRSAASWHSAFKLTRIALQSFTFLHL